MLSFSSILWIRIVDNCVQIIVEKTDNGDIKITILSV